MIKYWTEGGIKKEKILESIPCWKPPSTQSNYSIIKTELMCPNQLRAVPVLKKELDVRAASFSWFDTEQLSAFLFTLIISYIHIDTATKQVNALWMSHLCEILGTQAWLSTLSVHKETILSAYYHLNRLIWMLVRKIRIGLVLFRFISQPCGIWFYV